jgi:hypothetical protein
MPPILRARIRPEHPIGLRGAHRRCLWSRSGLHPRGAEAGGVPVQAATGSSPSPTAPRRAPSGSAAARRPAARPRSRSLRRRGTRPNSRRSAWPGHRDCRRRSPWLRRSSRPGRARSRPDKASPTALDAVAQVGFRSTWVTWVFTVPSLTKSFSAISAHHAHRDAQSYRDGLRQRHDPLWRHPPHVSQTLTGSGTISAG